MQFFDWISRRVFTAVHSNNLVYNTGWEDPRLDRIALEFESDDDVLVITSAGCNALDYAITGPRHVYAVDMNPRQNALLDLKKAAIKNLDYDDFFTMFGEGYMPKASKIYRDRLRSSLAPWAQDFWDSKIKWFANKRRTFYFRGTSGTFARLMKMYTDNMLKVRGHLDDLTNADSVEEQKAIYEQHLEKKFWSGIMRFTMNRDTTLSMLGVPKAQRRQIETQYEGGIVKFVQDCMESVFAKLPMKENYFWQVYMNGKYTRECCPEYLREENFQRLRDGLVDRISTHTDSVQGFLEKHDGTISKFILLDHMDWLSDHYFPMLESEWQAIIDKAAPNSRIIWRSGGLRTDFIDQVQIRRNGELQKVSPLLKLNTELADELHPRDRVHTYGSFYIADLSA